MWNAIVDEDEETSLKELAQGLLAAMGADLELVHGPARAVNGVTRRLADTSQAARRLGFSAEIDLETGLRDLVDWWRAERAADIAARTGASGTGAAASRTAAPAETAAVQTTAGDAR